MVLPMDNVQWGEECDERRVTFDEWFLRKLKEKMYRVYV